LLSRTREREREREREGGREGERKRAMAGHPARMIINADDAAK
jgi:hypothetical protein